MLKRSIIASVVGALCAYNTLYANPLQQETGSIGPGISILSEYDQEGLEWRLTIHEPSKKSLQFIDLDRETTPDLDDPTAGTDSRPNKRHKRHKSRNGGPSYRTHDGLAFTELFNTMHVAVPRPEHHFDSEARMPDSFLAKASEKLANEPQFTQQVMDMRHSGETQYQRVTPGVSHRITGRSHRSHYTRNISPNHSYIRNLDVPPPAPDFSPIAREGIYIRYPETQNLKTTLMGGETAQKAIQSKDPHGITSSFYALQTPKTPGETVSIAAATRGESGYTLASGSVVVDSNNSWSAVRARPAPSGGLEETEDWNTTSAGNPDAGRGWDSRDGEMTVGYDAFGSSNPGSIKGTFDEQIFPFPQTDAFTASNADTDEEDKFLGDYSSISYWNGWTFDFYAEDVLPSDLVFRFTDGVNTFFKSFASQVTTVGAWQTVRIYPYYNSGWIGGSAYDFEQTVKDVQQIDIQITRNGLEEQNFYVDNFNYTGNQIPEPDTAMFFVFGVAILTLRNKLNKREKLTRRG